MLDRDAGRVAIRGAPEPAHQRVLPARGVGGLGRGQTRGRTLAEGPDTEASVGVGSPICRTFATPWAVTLDIVPILLFIVW